LREVQLAAHRTGGDGGHLRLQALHVGDLVDALDGDQRGVHIGHDQAEIGKAALAIDVVGVHAQAGGTFQYQLTACGVGRSQAGDAVYRCHGLATGQNGQLGHTGKIEMRGLQNQGRADAHDVGGWVI